MAKKSNKPVLLGNPIIGFYYVNGELKVLFNGDKIDDLMCDFDNALRLVGAVKNVRRLVLNRVRSKYFEDD